MIARLSIATALLALVAFGAWYVVAAPSSDEPAPGQPHQTVTDSDGDEVQLGTELRTNEGRSKIPNGNTLTCIDTNKNAAWIHCRMIDRQSGDRVSCTDQLQGDAYGCIESGVGDRKYEIHQNGYKHRGSNHVYWNSRRSCHDCVSGGTVDVQAVEEVDASSPAPAELDPATATATATAAAN